MATSEGDHGLHKNQCSDKDQGSDRDQGLGRDQEPSMNQDHSKDHGPAEDQCKVKPKRKRKLPAWMTGGAGNTTNSKKEEKNATTLLNIPDYQFDGRITYIYRKDHASLLCEDLLEQVETADRTVVGLDLEWTVLYQRGVEPKTALLQLCMPDKHCYLFHLAVIGCCPKALKTLICSEKLIKVGVGISSDIWKLERDFDIPAMSIIEKSIIDLTKLANETLNSSENWSLDGLCQHLLNKKLDKDPSVRKGDWTRYPLTDRQETYAAADALVSLLVYNKLMGYKEHGR